MRTAIALFALSTLTFAGCIADPPETEGPGELQLTSAVSECGGFDEVRALVAEGGDYCGAERLIWEYDAAAETLSLANTRVVLNCCGNRSMSLEVVDGTYVVTETDAPDGEGGRCFCTCVFDFSLEATGVAEAAIPFRLQREVTDATAAPELVWQGVIDLAGGAGEVEISTEEVGAICEGEPEEIVVEETAVSECGGFGISLDPGEWSGGDYCDAERLLWTYSADNSTISIVNERVLANCCGERSIDIAMVDGTLVITETDAPEGGTARCWCMCVYDYSAAISGLAGGVVPARLVRDVTDAGGPAVIWEGDLDLSAGSGEVVTSTEEAGGFCEAP